MRIYFCGSIRGGRDDVTIYQRIIRRLQCYGSVLTEHVGSDELSSWGEEAMAVGGDQAIHNRDLDWLQQSDVVVAEVTQPSLGVGYELGRAVAMGKKIYCLFRPSSERRLSAMIRGADDGGAFIVRDYGEDTLDNVLEQLFREPTNNQPRSLNNESQ